MSYQAVYEVTRGLRMLLHSQLVLASPTAIVTLLPPGDTLPEASGVNLFLYRVLESPFLKNQPWPGDRVTPPSSRPPLALQLSYLLTPLGTRPIDASFEQGDDAHTMLGAAMQTLHENPILNDVHIPGFDADTVLPDFLLNSFEAIKITLSPTSLEELSKIWATINKPYRLSVAYEVSLVEVTPTPPPPVNGGVVLRTGLEVISLAAPRVTTLNPPQGALARVVGTALTPNTLQIGGFGMSFPGQAPVARVGGQAVAVSASPPPADQSLTVTLPAALDAGPQADVTVTLNRRTSTPLVFTVSPWLASLQPLRTALDAATPKLVLRGSGFTAAPQAVRFDGPGGTTNVTVFDPGGTDSQAAIAIPTSLANGIYNVRVVLAGGAASNPRTLEVIPRLDSATAAVVTVSGRQVHRLTLAGARLLGADLRLLVDAAIYVAGSNSTSATSVAHTLGRLLAAGTHTVAVQVDGQTSHAVELVI